MSEATRKPTLAAVKAPAQTSWKAWPWWWLASVLGLLLISSVQIWPKLDVPFILVFAFGWMGCCAISVTGHELAHFFVGRWARLQIWCLRIGGGKVVFQKGVPTDIGGEAHLGGKLRIHFLRRNERNALETIFHGGGRPGVQCNTIYFFGPLVFRGAISRHFQWSKARALCPSHGAGKWLFPSYVTLALSSKI